MIKDPIIEEVRETRRKTEAACEDNWEKLVEHYRQVQNTSDRTVIQGSPRRVAATPTDKPL